MTERRPHWTDELIETVRHRIQGFGYDALDEITHGVVAAVEDWARWEHVPKGTLARIERVKDYCERRREDRGGDLTALDVLRLLHGSPVVGDLSSQADDGQRLDVNALLSARMEQVERAKRAEAEVERLNRIISESKPWIDMADELADAQATIQRVRDVCDLWQRRHDSSIRHPADIPAVAITAVLRALGGGDDD